MHDPETDTLFPGVFELIRELSKDYLLVLISLAVTASSEKRRESIEESGIAKYFKLILVNEENKDEMYERALAELGVKPEEVAVVDDQVCRGIRWGNSRGAMTIWLKRGKFADELPTKETGDPAQVIGDIRELSPIFINRACLKDS